MIHNSPTLSPTQFVTCNNYNTSVCKKYEYLSEQTSLPIEVGLFMHARTQECDLTESLFELGLSTSYDHVMGNINSSECGQYHSENVVCSMCMYYEFT